MRHLRVKHLVTSKGGHQKGAESSGSVTDTIICSARQETNGSLQLTENQQKENLLHDEGFSWNQELLTMLCKKHIK